MDRRQECESDSSSEDSLRLIFHLYNRQKELPLAMPKVRAALRELCSFLAISSDELALYFVGKKRIGELHEEFFGDASPTDCISFPIDDSYLGEIFVCPAVALDYAKKRGLDPHEETLLYVVHGLLHLVGFDDLTPQAKRIMRKKEKSCMRHLSKQGLSLHRK
jgi:probable rRNA maturation factor